ncbi:MAG: PAS domain-containing protein [Candidatus Heimdallarchaeota archaeon]|nr:MAG: PAS domain-containing protein [Candidatus Heimdallarchaeota archaeon]
MNSRDSLEKSLDLNLLNSLPVGLVILDRLRDNSPIFVNKKACEDLQIRNNQRITKELFLAFLDPSERNRFLELSMRNTLPSVSEWKSLDLTGNQTWTQLRIAPIGEHYYIVVIRNISEIKEILAKLSATESQYQSLIESDPNFLFILKNGIIDYYNQAFIDKLGYTAEEIEQRRDIPTFLVAPEHREKIARILVDSKRKMILGSVSEDTQFFQKPEQTIEFDLLRKDGSRIPVHAILKRVYSEKNVFVQGILLDLSSVKELQDMKLDFLTLTQHHLRTPLATLKGFLDFYKRRLQDGISTEEKETLDLKLLDVFSLNIEQLVSLTEDLNSLALIRQERLKTNLRGENLNPILQQVIEDLEFLLRQYRIDLIVQYPSIPYIVNVDRIRISQALRNILENAIRFTGHGTVEITSFAEKNEFVRLVVEDNGVGINPAVLDDICKPFMTFHPSASGLGLGLYLTKEIIEAHNGTLEITSPGFNQGTTVTITLPLLVALDDVLPSPRTEILNEIIKTATTSENMLKRMDAVHQLGNGEYSEPELEKVITALEQIILYDKDRTIRNLAGQFYSEKVEKQKNATSDAS